MSHNSWNGFGPALRIEWRPSRWLRTFVFSCYAAAALAWLCLPVGWAAKAAGLALLAAFLARDCRFHLLGRHRRSVTALEYSDRRGWRIRLADGRWLSLPVRRPVFVTHRLVIATFGERSWPVYRLLLCADAVDARLFRHLRVRLLQSAHGDRDRAQVPGA